jgi:hypothetical protein
VTIRQKREEEEKIKREEDEKIRREKERGRQKEKMVKQNRKPACGWQAGLRLFFFRTSVIRN